MIRNQDKGWVPAREIAHWKKKCLLEILHLLTQNKTLHVVILVKVLYNFQSTFYCFFVDLQEQYSCLTIMVNLPCLRRPALGDTLCQPCTVPASHSLEPLRVTVIIIWTFIVYPSTHVHFQMWHYILFQESKLQQYLSNLASCQSLMQHAAIVLCSRLALRLIRKQRTAPFPSWDRSILIRANTWATNYKHKEKDTKK